MSAKDLFAILKTQSESHLGLAGQLIGVNIDSLEKMVSSQFSTIRKLAEQSSNFVLDDPSQTSASWVGLGFSSIEYWKAYALGNLEYQHRVLQTLARHSAK
jgi:hypothetical protein